MSESRTGKQNTPNWKGRSRGMRATASRGLGICRQRGLILEGLRAKAVGNIVGQIHSGVKKAPLFIGTQVEIDIVEKGREKKEMNLGQSLQQ